ncbi:hypothetical protein ILUMI_10082 [Ignelater luminosus]|uniref:Clip domain-containing protein n=1 Tax=Ignelater luminosus TaxID=2038154 RepID=A0A8K0GDY1_IGNLU|nr:hypothetical protein ILUMI_10082 [Ignelater luminosus]
MYLKIFIIFVYSSFIFAQENENSCVTPNGEAAKCIPIDDCKVIKQAITYLEEDAIAFARKSQCGFNNVPLVCCGTTGRLTTTTPEFNFEEVTSSPAILPTPINDINLPDDTLCGIQGRTDKILGGEITGVFEFPWMVALKYVQHRQPSTSSFRCSGTLINQRYVLTAAQCLNIKGYNLTEARLGEWMISTEKNCKDEDEQTC